MGRKIRDLTGQRFGRLVVLSCVGKTKQGYMWQCLCDCGQKAIILSYNLTRGGTKSCGCYRKDMWVARSKVADPTGKRFGRLLVIRKVGHDVHRNIVYECACDCGNIVNILKCHLTSGATKSCGCYGKEMSSQVHTTHGMSGTPEYYSVHHKRRRDRKILFDTNWTLEMEIALKQLFNSCRVCGRTHYLAVDHVYPLSGGYGLEPGNAVILCKSCNSKKNDKLPEELPDDMRIPILRAAKEFKDYWEVEHHA